MRNRPRRSQKKRSLERRQREGVVRGVGGEHNFCNVKEAKGGFPGGTLVKNPPASAGDTGLSPGLGRSHMPRSN